MCLYFEGFGVHFAGFLRLRFTEKQCAKEQTDAAVRG